MEEELKENSGSWAEQQWSWGRDSGVERRYFRGLRNQKHGPER